MRPDDSHDSTPPRLTKAQYWHYYQRYPYLLAKVALWTAVLGVIYWLTRNVEAVLFPVLVSLLLAYLLDPAADWLEERLDRVEALKKAEASRTLAILVFMTLLLTATVGFVLILYPALAKQIGNLVKRAPELAGLAQNSILPWIETNTDFEVPANVSEAVAEYGDTIKEQIPGVMKRVSQLTANVLTSTGAVVVSILNLVMIPVFTFYFLRDFDAYKEKLREFVPINRRAFYMQRLSMMDEVVGAWFRGQVTVALILAVLYSIGLMIVFGISGVGAGTGLAIGVMSGVLNIVPYFGFLIGFVLSLLMVLLDWGGFGPVIGVLVVFGIVQGLEGWIITPKVVGDKVGLSPVAAIIVLLLGGELFGLLGVLLALPVAGIVVALIPDIVSYYKSTPFYSGNYDPDEAAAAAAHGAFDISPGLAEETDGSIDPEDEEEEEDEPPIQVDPSSLKRPLTGEQASVGDRPESSPSPLDVGTDGDAEDDDEEVGPPPEPAEPPKPKLSKLPRPPATPTKDDEAGD